MTEEIPAAAQATEQAAERAAVQAAAWYAEYGQGFHGFHEQWATEFQEQQILMINSGDNLIYFAS